MMLIGAEFVAPVLVVELRNTDEMGERDPKMVVVGPKRANQLHPMFVGTLWGHGAFGLVRTDPTLTGLKVSQTGNQ